MKNKLFLAALVVLTLIGCEKPQSEMILDGANVQVATLTGKVTYNPGGSNGKTIAADSVEVRAIVANSQYSAGAQGMKQFPAVRTDKNGFYSISIPVGQVTISGVRVEVVPFQGEYTDPNSGVKQTVFYTSDQLPATGLALNAGDVRNVDIEMKPELTFRDYTSSVQISGIVSVDAGLQKVASGYEKAVKPYANGILKVKGIYIVDGSSVERELEDVTTNESGEYTFAVPAGSVAASVTISTVRFDGEYTREVNGEYRTTSVYYRVAQHAISFKASDVEKRNENFTVSAYDEAPDLGKEYVIKRISATIKTIGEKYNDINSGEEEFEKYEMTDAFLPFNVRLILSCPDFDAANPSHPLAGNKLIFTKQASEQNGVVTLHSVPVYNVWEGYDINVRIEAEDLMKPMTHYYFKFSGFDKNAYHSRTWADWHKSGDLLEPLSASFWKNCWPSGMRAQELEGYYHLPYAVSEDIPANTLHYYGEYDVTNPAVLRFEPRDPKLIKGVWSNVNYNTRNDKDDITGSYVPFEVPDDAVDADNVPLINVTTNSKVLIHDKYQAACRSYWKSRFPSLN